MRAPIAGGTVENLLGKTYPWVLGRYSPDGEQIGLLLVEEESSAQVTLAVMNSRTRVVERTFRVPFGGLPDNAQGGLRWTPDGKALLFPLEREGTTDLWMQSVSGVPPRQLTHSGHVVAYAWSPDGTRLAVARSTTSSDVVVFRNFH